MLTPRQCPSACWNSHSHWLALPCRAEEEEETTSACPFCGAQGSETELDCAQCQNIIPFCIASGASCQPYSLRLFVCWPLQFG